MEIMHNTYQASNVEKILFNNINLRISNTTDGNLSRKFTDEPVKKSDTKMV